MSDAHDPARTTLSFYRYVRIDDPHELVAKLRAAWAPLGVRGRIYVASEGINAQLSLPSSLEADFIGHLRTIFAAIPVKKALEEPTDAFTKLTIKVRAQLVAHGLEVAFDSSDVGTHLDAAAFHAAMDDSNALVVDMRNRYESEVGHFTGALLPEANTFREALTEVVHKLGERKDAKVLLYCTGGIRCEMASAWLRHHGFQDVQQLHGGIIDYARQINATGTPSRFVGKNFVFDQRLGERVTPDVIAHCHQCAAACDTHTNCAFPGCNRLFLQCPACAQANAGCCSGTCQDALGKPREEQIALQHAWEQEAGKDVHWSRTRLPPVQPR